ncbi:type II toxin-antitoxin system VapC family toxin [Kamptonema cortianum]|uniref:Type II toxin-antitoxin system VapC family toxin n=1 Tax=Geitlerinema calcuttense NRMC-F 0142 TaxID=2922238 RepID=A0ABT7M471_9CYAN|nr:type II toxin-antitoxin system VapC family toxin [Geitlerinema calcuttense]MDK3161903.1 type II toxin-antitoxin system VapC family toxin [Kamptonema cortianum]MDL5050577.1 type II toxin-antitoxin system VapC family toxin [Oscillatoria amoena NRMC-F 0135]MDL5055593.1 type II toxin-antitoxin system VapC family toxin [Oscillatoria laete-virens NRMC-F 0139]MDL5057841.1 type II toxin-antitoxin system VapC family toxin [Geitlerinema calcuttense NRMC-F 0142]
MRTLYFDSTYIFKIQCNEFGTPEVRACAAHANCVASALHGRAEFISACHRKIRESSGTHGQLRAMLAQMQMETDQGALKWLPITAEMIAHVESVVQDAPASCYLRASDAIHLACAAQNGFQEIYSNDRHLLAAAPLFGLRGVNVIPQK